MLRMIVPRFVLLLPLAALAMTGSPAATPSEPALARVEQGIATAKAAMMGDPGQAEQAADAALASAQRLPDSRRARIAVATAQWLSGEARIGLNQLDQARPIVDAAIATAQRDAPGTKLEGDLMRSRGAIAASQGHVQDALSAFQRAYQVFGHAHEPRSQAIALSDIGQIYSDAADYERSLRYYTQAGDTYDKDPALLLSNHNNRAEVLRKVGRRAAAEREYQAALLQAHRLKSELLEVRIRSNLAQVQAQQGKLVAAQATIVQAARLARAGEAAGWRPFVTGVQAQIAALRGDDAAAATLLDAMFTKVDLTATDMQFKEFHELAARVYERTGKPQLALAHLKAAARLETGARDLTASSSAQLLSARFDFANQNLKISKLKADQLQRDIRARTWLLGTLLVAGGIVFAMLLLGFFSIRRSRNEVRAANVTLTTVNDKLESALKAKTEFLATTSHEIRTPLNGILGMTQVLLADPRLAGEVREKVEVVHGAGETMRALVDDILDVAKMETGEVTLALAPTDPERLLANAARLWRGHADAKGVELLFAAEDLPPLIVTDETRLRQIVFNLMSNAVKFTPTGSISLIAAVARDDVGETLVITVSDTGIGIPADQHALVFEPFHQVDGGVTRQFSGTGLGLAICRRLVTAMGGTIALHSDGAGTGARFVVRLPLERVAERGSAQDGLGGATGPVRAAATALDGARLLVVDANMLTQAILAAVLTPAVDGVEQLGTVAAACARLDGGDIDHVLIEAGGLRGDGPDPLAGLRALLASAEAMGARTTMLVSATDGGDVAALLALSPTQAILKPVGAGDLIAAMRSLYVTADADVGGPGRMRSAASVAV